MSSSNESEQTITLDTSTYAPSPSSNDNRNIIRRDSNAEEFNINNSEARGPARFGYFVETTAQNADKVCVLVVHYEFFGFTGAVKERKGNKQDLQSLRKTFFQDRRCLYNERKSPSREELLSLLGDEEKLMHLFKSGTPSVFLLFILSHGIEDGKIQTEVEDRTERDGYACFTTEQVVNALKTNPVLKDSLKIIFFGACRGKEIDKSAIPQTGFQEQDEHYDNRNACRLTPFPGEKNFILVYPSVECTASTRDEDTGTWMIKETCEVLNSLQEDVTLEVLLATLQRKVHLCPTDYIHLPDRNAQTVEIKFTPHKKLIIHKALQTSSDSHLDLLNREDYFSWRTEENFPVRGKIAGIFYDAPSTDVTAVCKALRDQLDFEIHKYRCSVDDLQDKFLSSANDCQSFYGCILLCFFGQISEIEGEVCIKMGGCLQKVGEIVHMFVGPKNQMWISRPKIFFFVNQETRVGTDYIGKESPLDIKGTNHSGWFIHIMPHQDSGSKLAKMLENCALRDGRKSFQELAMEILHDDYGKNSNVQSQISSTLHHLLDFPDWSKNFVPPKLKITQVGSSDSLNWVPFERVEMEYIEELEAKEEYCIRIVSALSGCGKSTLISELTHDLRMKQNRIVVKFQLSSQEGFFVEHLQTSRDIFDKFIKFDNFRKKHITSDVLEEKNVIFLYDGFDEACPIFRKNALNLIRSIANQKLPLWITTRPEELDQISSALSNIRIKVLEILPFDREEKVRVLQVEKNNLSAEICEKKLGNLEAMGAGDLLQNPLNLTLVAKSDKGSLFELYDDVVDKKVRESLKSDYIKPMQVISRIRLLQKYALHVVVGKYSQIQLPDVQKLTEEEIYKINVTGIATVFDGQLPKFMHQTFAEFLVAKQFLDDLVQTDDGSSDIKMFENDEFVECRRFVDSFFSVEKNRATVTATKFIEYVQKTPCLESFLLEKVLNEGLVNIFIATKVLFTFNSTANDNKYLISEKYLMESAFKCGKLTIELVKLPGFNLDFSEFSIICDIATKKDENLCLLYFLASKSPSLYNRYIQSDSGKVTSLVFTATKSDNVDMLNDLIKSNLVDVTMKNHLDETALHCASQHGSLKCAELLLNNGVDVNYPDSEGITALHRATMNHDHKMLELLLSRSADLRATDYNGRNVLHWAALYGTVETAKFLLQKCNFNAVLSEELSDNDFQGQTEPNIELLYSKPAAHQQQHTTFTDIRSQEVLKRLQLLSFTSRQSPGRSYGHSSTSDSPLIFSNDPYDAKLAPLLMSVQNIDVNVCRFFVENYISDFGPIVRPLVNAFQALNEAIRHKKFPVAKMILTIPGFDVNWKDETGKTALHWAIEGTKPPGIEWLLNRGADIEQKTESGATPLLLAASFSTPQVCKLLMDKGADIKAVDNEGNTCLHLACAANKIKNVEYLTADVTLDINKKNLFGRTALHLAAGKGKEQLVSTLLAANADPDIMDDTCEWTAFHFAIRSNTPQVIKLLLPAGENWKEDKTLKELAVKNHNIGVLSLFAV